jgi:nitroimidazol reductase NimA-like FMN-containing flavoprotein (pyridoxamine 5'-phosphate oxidase superfamily)
MNPEQAAQIAREIIEANHYLVLATADAAGDPWSTPVYFAHIGYREQYWVSSPTAAHSRNIAARATVSIAIFDSHARIGTGQGVYMSAIAAQVKDTELAPGITVFSDRSLRHGGVQWTAADVTGDSELRLYRATADQHWILAKDGEPDHRIPVDVTP